MPTAWLGPLPSFQAAKMVPGKNPTALLDSGEEGVMAALLQPRKVFQLCWLVDSEGFSESFIF